MPIVMNRCVIKRIWPVCCWVEPKTVHVGRHCSDNPKKILVGPFVVDSNTNLILVGPFLLGRVQQLRILFTTLYVTLI
jgi:hypothetical protein